FQTYIYMSITLDAFFYTLFFYYSSTHRDLHSFPTRRSSDLDNHTRAEQVAYRDRISPGNADGICDWSKDVSQQSLQAANFAGTRSEEHTSELQSRENLVCRLLLEKKKKKKKKIRYNKNNTIE